MRLVVADTVYCSYTRAHVWASLSERPTRRLLAKLLYLAAIAATNNPSDRGLESADLAYLGDTKPLIRP